MAYATSTGLVVGVTGVSGTLTPATITGANHNYNPTGLRPGVVVYQDLSAAASLSGMAAQPDGTEIRIVNVATNTSRTLTINHQDSNSSIANRFILPNGANLVIPAGSSVIFKYNLSATKWYALVPNDISLYSTSAAIAAAYATVGRSSQPVILASPMFCTTGAGVALGTSAAKAQFLGYAYRDFTAAENFTFCWRQTAAGSGFTFGECAIATGTFTPGSAPTLTVKGYVDATTQMALGTGNTTTAVVPVSNGQTIAAGAAIWGIFAKQSTGSPSMNSTLAEVNATGLFCTLSTANWRPSSNVGSAVAWTIETTSTQQVKFFVVSP